MIWADEKVTEDEYNTLKKYCKKFEFLDENIPEMVDYLLECAKSGTDKDKIINELNA